MALQNPWNPFGWSEDDQRMKYGGTWAGEAGMRVCGELENVFCASAMSPGKIKWLR